MQVSIVILNWNGEKYLSQFLPILIEKTQLSDVEIVVADNGSTDNSVKLLQKNFPSVKLLLFDKNYGFAGGYNKALNQLQSDYFVLLNSDMEVTDNWLQPMLEYMKEHENVAACQPKIHSYFRRSYFEHAGAAGGFIDPYGFAFCRGRIFGKVEKDRGQYDDIKDIFWASGACMMVRAELFSKVGGFDDEFFAHMEEIDLCWRFNSRGYRVICVPQSVVYHIGGGTLNAEHPHKTYLNFRNNLLLLYKNLPNYRLKNVMQQRTIFDYLAAFQLFISGKFKNAQSVLRARKDFKRMKNRFEGKRKENILYSTVSDLPTIYPKSIVIEYYLKGKKKFSDLYFPDLE